MLEQVAAIDRVLLIPGLLELRLAMLPLQHRLAKRWENVEIWRDRYIFRDVDASVARLSDWIRDDGSEKNLAIVTHSFGDWLARRAIAQTPRHRVVALASIAPVFRSGCVINAIHWMGGDFIPEIKIISDSTVAAENADCDREVRRLVVWAKIDWAVRPVDLSHLRHIERDMVRATHLSVIMQPNVHTKIERFLLNEHPSTGS